MPRESKHELTCVPCARLEEWRTHNEKCRTCNPATGAECTTGKAKRQAYIEARAEADHG